MRSMNISSFSPSSRKSNSSSRFVADCRLARLCWYWYSPPSLGS